MFIKFSVSLLSLLTIIQQPSENLFTNYWESPSKRSTEKVLILIIAKIKNCINQICPVLLILIRYLSAHSLTSLVSSSHRRPQGDPCVQTVLCFYNNLTCLCQSCRSNDVMGIIPSNSSRSDIRGNVFIETLTVSARYKL